MKQHHFLSWGQGATIGLSLYCVGVMLGGAMVRITRSGAGCGSDWPLCQGAIIPQHMPWSTVLEFSHRLSSGISLIGVVLLAFYATRYHPSYEVKKASHIALGSILAEALLGAALVLFRLVEYNTSYIRMMVLGIHLLNTFLLLYGLITMAFYFYIPSGTRKPWNTSDKAITAGLLAIMVLGGIAGLSHSIFPSNHLLQGLIDDFLPQSPWLIRLRILHPFISILFFIPFIYYKKYLPSPTLILLTANIVLGSLLIITYHPMGITLLHIMVAYSAWASWIVHLHKKSL